MAAEYPTTEQMFTHLKTTNALAKKAVEDNHHPFAAILVAPDNETVLMTQGNVDEVNHAEATLARRAAKEYDADYLWDCTLYTTVEPCAMCSGTQYWANIGRLVYGMSEKALLGFTGNHEENPTFDLPCRDVFERGQKDIKVWGPFEELFVEISEPHMGFWTD